MAGSESIGHGSRHVTLMTADHGGMMSLRDSKGRNRWEMIVSPDRECVLKLRDSKGKIVWGVALDKNDKLLKIGM